ncbi:trehalase family glycosidase [Flavobacterium sp. FlaQc-52]|jgi:hypothetical protein|uniref:trehalase family glycosidase n=1 Tax=Flavobacterium sp. FlaQc-52 TaxID=3374185 RepID=UPI003756FEEE
MKNILILMLFNCGFVLHSKAQETVRFKSSDQAIEKAFVWAKETALSYKGDPDSPVGAWYEAALPSREAFCMRDISHQSIGAEVLGLGKANKNMFSLFAKNISENKDWCSYWEINKLGNPAPADYRNDKEFWYNLNANFDMIQACWRLYVWTGDETYIKSPEFIHFYEKSVTDYIERWILEVDSLLTRPMHPNAPIPFDVKDDFHRCRGLASYDEDVPDLKMGVDLVASIYSGLVSYSKLLKANGNLEKAAHYQSKALRYKEQIDQIWWDQSQALYQTYYTADGKFGKSGGAIFLLWFNALTDETRIQKTIEHIISSKNNVETSSYLPTLLYQHGFEDKAYQYILYLSNPETKRREYPEVSYGIIEGIVSGFMGIEPNSEKNSVTTLYRGKRGTVSELDNLPVLNTTIAIKQNEQETVFHNKGTKTLLWRAKFAGKHQKFLVNGIKMKTGQEDKERGKTYSFIDIPVAEGQIVTVSCL